MKTHKIETIQDILNTVDETNYKAFIIDFAEIVEQMANLRTCHDNKPMLLKSFDWIDDGKHDVKTSVNYLHETLEITGTQEPNKSE